MAREFGLDIGRQCINCSRMVGCGRQASDKRIVSSKKTGLESMGSHVKPLNTVECVKTFLPCHTIGVERAAKIEQESFDRLLGLRCDRASSRLTTRFAGIRGPQPPSYPHHSQLGLTTSLAS